MAPRDFASCNAFDGVEGERGNQASIDGELKKRHPLNVVRGRIAGRGSGCEHTTAMGPIARIDSGHMDLWQAMKAQATKMLSESIDGGQFDRAKAVKALEVMAAADNKGTPPDVRWGALTDQEIKGIAEAIVMG
jgi:hypothetical protein